jgi:hypothetical protein
MADWLQNALSKAEDYLEKADDMLADKIGGFEDEEDTGDLRDYVPRKARATGQYVERQAPKLDVDDDDILAGLGLAEPSPTSKPAASDSAIENDAWSDEEEGGEGKESEEKKEAETKALTARSTRAKRPEPSPAAAAGPADPSHVTTESEAKGLGEALAENARLKSDNNKLNAELDDMDDRMIRAQDQLDKSNELAARTKRMAREKIEEMQEKLKDHMELQGSDEQQFSAALEVKGKQCSALQIELDEAMAEIDSQKSKVAAMHRSMEEAAAAQEEASQAKAQASGASVEEVTELRQELQVLEAKLEQEKEAHQEVLREGQRREGELEEQNAALALALAKSERTMAARDESAMGEDGADSGLSAESHRDIQLDLQSTHAALSLEKEQVQALQQELTAVMTELASARQTEESTRKESISGFRTREREIDKLKRELAQLGTQGEQTSDGFGGLGLAGDGGAEQRLKQLSDTMLRRTEELSVSKTELTAMCGRLQRMQQRAERAEKSVQEHDSGGGEISIDMESGGNSGLVSRRRNDAGKGHGGSGSMSAELKPLMKHKDVLNTVDALDKFALETGRFLRYNPMARLLFLMYLILLHLWALFILAFHSHQIEKMHADTGGAIKIPGQ